MPCVVEVMELRWERQCPWRSFARCSTYNCWARDGQLQACSLTEEQYPLGAVPFAAGQPDASARRGVVVTGTVVGTVAPDHRGQVTTRLRRLDTASEGRLPGTRTGLVPFVRLRRPVGSEAGRNTDCASILSHRERDGSSGCWRHRLGESQPVLACGGTEYHLLNGHVHPDLRVVEVAEAILGIAGLLLRDQRLYALKALAPGVEQFGTCGTEGSVELLIAICHADITVLSIAKCVTGRRALYHDELAGANAGQQ